MQFPFKDVHETGYNFIYSRKKWNQQIEFESWARPFVKYESNNSPSSYGQIWGQTAFFYLQEGRQFTRRKMLSSSQVFSCHKLTLCQTTRVAEKLG